MNEHVALWPKLDLARELPFALAGTQVRPAALEVETEGAVTGLEPRVMKVLVALHRGRGHPVSRDELIDLCWQGRIVTEGAINRCIAQLRKALAPNPQVRLETIPTVGYRLQASAEVVRVAGEPQTPPAVARRSGRRWWVAGALAAVALAAIAAWALLPRPVTWTEQAFHPLTGEPGFETHPALSPDGEQLVYAQRADMTVRRDLYLRSVDQGTPVRITSHPDDEFSAAWSPTGDRIAFVRVPVDGPCTLVVASIPLGPERAVVRCQSATFTRVTWLDGKTLAYGDRPDVNHLWRIRAVDIETGRARDLTTPDAATLGDGDPMASPDGRKMVFRRTVMHGVDDLMLLDLKTGRERALTTDGWKAAGYVWSADSRHIFYATNRGGEFGLWTIDTRLGTPPKRISLGLGQISFSRMSADRRNRLAVESRTGRTNIAALLPSGAVVPVTDAAGMDWDPEGAADGTVAYVSSRSGAPELWVTGRDKLPVRLTSIVGSYLTGPAWSPDGRSLAFVSVKGRRSDIFLIQRDGARLRSITWDGLDKVDPQWSVSGDRLFYLERSAAGYRLMQKLLAGDGAAQVVPGGEGWRELRRGPDGRLFGLTVDGRIVALNGAQPPPVRVTGYDTWAVGPQGIYVLTVLRQEPAALWLHPWSGAPRKLLDVPNSDGTLGLGPDGRVLFSHDLEAGSDLGLFELSAR